MDEDKSRTEEEKNNVITKDRVVDGWRIIKSIVYMFFVMCLIENIRSYITMQCNGKQILFKARFNEGICRSIL